MTNADRYGCQGSGSDRSGKSPARARLPLRRGHARHPSPGVRPSSGPPGPSVHFRLEPALSTGAISSRTLVELLAAAGALQETDSGLIGRACGSPASASFYSPIRAFLPPSRMRSFSGPTPIVSSGCCRSSLADVPAATPCRLIDIGCGSGAGGLFAAHLLNATEVVLADINRKALVVQRRQRRHQRCSARKTGVQRCAGRGRGRRRSDHRQSALSG